MEEVEALGEDKLEMGRQVYSAKVEKYEAEIELSKVKDELKKGQARVGEERRKGVKTEKEVEPKKDESKKGESKKRHLIVANLGRRSTRYSDLPEAESTAPNSLLLFAGLLPPPIL